MLKKNEFVIKKLRVKEICFSKRKYERNEIHYAQSLKDDGIFFQGKKSHTLTVLSYDPDTIMKSSKRKHVTPSVCLCNVTKRSPLSKHQI